MVAVTMIICTVALIYLLVIMMRPPTMMTALAPIPVVLFGRLVTIAPTLAVMMEVVTTSPGALITMPVILCQRPARMMAAVPIRVALIL